MLTLYVKPYCFYCAQVLRANEKIGAELVLRDVVVDPAAYAELVATGGKGQTPFLVDTERCVSMYESLDIIMYLEKYYSKATAPIVLSTEAQVKQLLAKVNQTGTYYTNPNSKPKEQLRHCLLRIPPSEDIKPLIDFLRHLPPHIAIVINPDRIV